ncbi:hypothetical protein CN151_21940 [Sinorhizobium meliloti]|nr:hypothetical protein SMB554_31145 [Sinorhizobium meliloti]ASQ00218.1 hypothetical protein CDO24_22665 [Sinorhizobium meliloti]ASQ14117.1 hypothetical protein CDO22_29800 [Sinorhizobium meliloti]ATA97140.1 hypothetical protein BWO76_12625 [Sinorhizobium meliloti]RVE82492.1 hypothetical protein CN240_12145 [Sinorhizobium meliloti]
MSARPDIGRSEWPLTSRLTRGLTFSALAGGERAPLIPSPRLRGEGAGRRMRGKFLVRRLRHG